MLELKLKGYTEQLDLSSMSKHSFSDPIIFYLANKDDIRSFLIAFVILDFKNNELQYLFSFIEENIKRIECEADHTKFVFHKAPHCSILVNKDRDFLTFFEDEKLFAYISTKEMTLTFYSMNDILKDDNIEFKRISSTFYKEKSDSDYIYISAVDSFEQLHIFKLSFSLNDITEIDTFPSHPFPPHVLRKHKDKLLISDEFKYSKFELQKEGRIISHDDLAKIYVKQYMRSQLKNKSENFNHAKETFCFLKEQYAPKCLPGRILLLDMNTKEKKYFKTTGGSPAHFEIDTEHNFIYTSSHNFLGTANGLVLLEPAVIDKFRLENDELVHEGFFSYSNGYRYTSHKIFTNNNKSYICTFGQPNRLILIDAETMLLYDCFDVEEDKLSDQEDTALYINSRIGDLEIVALEVSPDGDNIIFIGSNYIYFYNFSQKVIYEKINFRACKINNSEINLKDYSLRTVHMNYLV